MAAIVWSGDFAATTSAWLAWDSVEAKATTERK
jgi:hypothetical protein